MLQLNMPHPVDLRKYQARTIREVRAAYQTGARGVFMVGPCGSGKTTMFVDIAASWVANGGKVAIGVHRQELIYQAGSHVLGRGLPYGVIRASNSTNPDAPIQLCSIDSMRTRALPWIPNAIIVDEAHFGLAPRFMDWINQYHDALLLFASATPVLDFSSVCDQMIVSCSISDLIADPDGPYLVNPVMYTGVDIAAELAECRTTGDDYNNGELGDVMRQSRLLGDIVDEYRAKAYGRTGVVFCVNVAHSLDVCKQFNDAGIPAEQIDAKTSDEDRRAVLYRLKTKQTWIVCNAMLLCEGWDEPTISYVGGARPTKSLALYLQQSCRGLRISQGKTDCIILDHGMNEALHGHILDDREWSLTGPRWKKKKGDPSNRCKNCGALMPAAAHVCVACGWRKVIFGGVETVIAPLSEKKVDHPLVKKFRLLLRWAKKNGKTGGWAYLKTCDEYGMATVDRMLPYRLRIKLHREEGIHE